MNISLLLCYYPPHKHGCLAWHHLCAASLGREWRTPRYCGSGAGLFFPCPFLSMALSLPPPSPSPFTPLPTPTHTPTPALPPLSLSPHYTLFTPCPTPTTHTCLLHIYPTPQHAPPHVPLSFYTPCPTPHMPIPQPAPSCTLLLLSVPVTYPHLMCMWCGALLLFPSCSGWILEGGQGDRDRIRDRLDIVLSPCVYDFFLPSCIPSSSHLTFFAPFACFLCIFILPPSYLVAWQ